MIRKLLLIHPAGIRQQLLVAAFNKAGYQVFQWLDLDTVHAFQPMATPIDAIVILLKKDKEVIEQLDKLQQYFPCTLTVGLHFNTQSPFLFVGNQQLIPLFCDTILLPQEIVQRTTQLLVVPLKGNTNEPSFLDLSYLTALGGDQIGLRRIALLSLIDSLKQHKELLQTGLLNRDSKLLASTLHQLLYSFTTFGVKEWPEQLKSLEKTLLEGNLAQSQMNTIENLIAFLPKMLDEAQKLVAEA